MNLILGLVQTLERKTSILDEERGGSGDVLASYGGRDLSSFWLSHAINSGIVPLRAHLNSGRSHPKEVYLELARLAGALCTFRISSDSNLVPLYDHENLSDCFEQLDHHIRGHLEVSLPTTCEVVNLKKRNFPGFYTASVRSDQCAEETLWFFGVRSDRLKLQVVEAVKDLVKIADAKDCVELITTGGMGGLPLEYQSQPPRELAFGSGWEYFLVKREVSLWRALRDSMEVGVWVPPELQDADLTLAIVMEPTD
jgi:type VI secretion system protein ImpJ